MKTGIVKFFNEAKGFGFIMADDDKSEIFVHHSGLIEKVRENDKVEFETMQGKRGLNAINVRKIA
jgi:CspA family cold shock protein